jgi:protein-S-isoprenylcysteine O-methyltransferase Ste14
MQTLRVVIMISWLAFWIYWLASATRAKQSTGTRSGFRISGVSVLAILLLVRILRGGSLEVHSLALGAIGSVMFVCGIALAIWARFHLGSNWGMPMTQKEDPELVTSGPYQMIRNPIYTGLLIAMLGTALVTNLAGLVVVAILSGYFYYSATVEERNLARAFPASYPAYRAGTKKLIPFIL